MLTALGIAAFFAGLAGTWSPCGFSVIETLRPGGASEHRGTTVAAVVTFAGGTLAGALVTFVALSALGSALPHPANAVPAGIALAAGALDALGVRVVPQVRHQVPESTRRRLRLPLAAAIYGVLLGLAFTTFVLAFAVWALAGIVLALGSLHAGIVIGACFAVGRALPVVAIAPIADLPLGRRIGESMSERPRLLRGVRLADGVALCVAALVIAAPSASAAATTVAAPAEDPSASAAGLAWQVPGGAGFLGTAEGPAELPCVAPALGGALLACLRNDQTVIGPATTPFAPTVQLPTPGADKLAVSDRWLVWRVPGPPQDTILAGSLQPPGPPHAVARASSPDQLGRPSLDGATLVFAENGPRPPSRIIAVDLDSGTTRTLLASRTGQLLNPSVDAGRLLYESVDDCREQLLLARLAAPAHAGVLARRSTEVPRDGGYGPHAIRVGRTPHHCVGPLAGSYPGVTSYWTTALSPTTAYVTQLFAANGELDAQLLQLPA
ncbi:MAG TPA: hypothetical protein VHR88_13300 [Solirubrobacteraceae bacterium]|nr:hypothetical protein [Solirubrobacteraceae bacterium]